MPDLTIILDVPADQGLARAAKRRGAGPADRFEDEAIEYHDKLREAFRALAAQEPDRCVLIDATRPRPVVAEHIWREVEARCPGWRHEREYFRAEGRQLKSRLAALLDPVETAG